jgi:hypothetical protein
MREIVMAGLVPAISMRRAQRFNKTRLGVVRALLIEITGTSPVMTSVGASISSEHALADDAGKVTNTGGHGHGLGAIAT